MTLDWRTSYPAAWPPVLLHHYFLRHAQTRPGAPAVAYVDTIWTYGQLQEHAIHYAAALDEIGLAPGDRIILELEPSPPAVALICACSMLGLIFVPVSPELPQARVEDIIDQTEPQLHIQLANESRCFSNRPDLRLGFLDNDTLQLEGHILPDRRSRQGPILETDLIYIIFTSGSTGRPKGIMMSHRAVLTFFRGVVAHCALRVDDSVGTIAPLQFDLSLLDMGVAFGSGATLVQVPRMLFHHPKRMLRYLAEQRVTQLNCVPSVWRTLLAHGEHEIAGLQHLKSILSGGETVPIADLQRLRALRPDLRFINCFGQSESIACSFTDVPCPMPSDLENLSIGVGQPGTEMLLLDEQAQEITEPGVVGEIYLRAANLFSGYWRDPQATERVLIPHPFRPFSEEKVFRTGDLAYKGPQGELYFKGRRDWQVKVLGNRVEVEEVERNVCTHPAVLQAAAIAVQHNGRTTIVAYVVRRQDAQPLATEALLLFCSQSLPKYMMPSQIHFVDSLPSATNGKVDRSGLKKAWETNNQHV